ncbi:hypothetical protein JHK82_041331 [Glycine max]|nr:hypothetical protein JHK85_041997 [Glycine max]KAG5104361.1 hypothetical protein JHK82_041331 [Glycine max]KAG5115486.1 hypothetical protein JHK84_041599 [Glycine max]
MPPFVARVPLICVPNSPSVTIVGDAFRVYATLQIIGPAILSLWAVGPGRLSKATTAAAVALAAFVVVLPWPQSTNLIAKRISLGQICSCGVRSNCDSSLSTGRACNWERLPIKTFRPNCLSLIERLQEVDTNLRGMELALSCTNSFPMSNILDQDLKHVLNSLEEHVTLTIKQAKQSLRGGSLTVPESNAKTITHFLQSLHTIPTTHQDLPIFFFLFCAKLPHKK